MKTQKLPKRRIQRAFYQWLMESRETFSIPVSVLRRRANILELRLAGITPVLAISLHKNGIVVAANMDGICWDLLACFEGGPEKIREGYVCALCDPETRSIFPSRQAIWCEEIFERFRNWVNDELAHRESVAFYQTDGRGTTWVEIGHGLEMRKRGVEYLHAVIPLRLKETRQLR